jgi:hypothetical protein
MTVFQLVPSHLQGTYFFKVIQRLLQSITDPSASKVFKYALFNILHIETNSTKFAATLNNEMRDIHEELQAGSQVAMQLATCTNLYTAEAEHTSQLGSQRIFTQVASQPQESEDAIMEESISLEERMVKVAEEVEATHNFDIEISEKKEQEK